MVSKADEGSHNSSSAPAMPPEKGNPFPARAPAGRSPASSRPVAQAPESEPGASPTVLEILAVTGGTPRASRVGNVINVPEPTTVLINPAAAVRRPKQRQRDHQTRSLLQVRLALLLILAVRGGGGARLIFRRAECYGQLGAHRTL